MSISISNEVRIAIMRDLEMEVEEVGGDSTSDIGLAEIEDIIWVVLIDMENNTAGRQFKK